jgi:hypothetical protein
MPENGDLVDLLGREMLLLYGPIVGGDRLHQILGFTSSDAFRQAAARKQLPIPVFRIPRRRGQFALTADLATWLVTLREGALTPGPAPVEVPTRAV